RWIRFPTVRTRCWRDGNVLLIGDAAHTAHFSIGSGTKLAMEDALALAACLHENPSVDSALAAYETERRPVVESAQRAAQASLEWFENISQYTRQEPLQFAFHLVHLGSKALGGAALVMTEMVCVSREGRITPGCAGLYKPEHEAALAHLVEFVHGRTPAKIGIQLGHSGRKGSTKLMWEGMDEPLASGNWELIAPSPLPYLPAGQTPREMTRADMDLVRNQFVSATRMAVRAGFDLLEL